MAWVRIEDDFYDHGKFDRCGPLGVALWAAALAWCNRNLSDGIIPRGRARTLLDFDGLAFVGPSNGLFGHGEDVTAEAVIAALLDAGLWEKIEGGYLIHDYGDYQPSAQDVQERRAAEHEAKVRGGQRRAASARRTSSGSFAGAPAGPQSPADPPDKPAGHNQQSQQRTQQPTSSRPAAHPAADQPRTRIPVDRSVSDFGRGGGVGEGMAPQAAHQPEPAESSKPRRRRLPEGWEPHDVLRRWSLSQPGAERADLELELANFSDHHHAKGSTMIDWDAAWRTWWRKALSWSAQPSKRGRAGPPDRTAGIRAYAEARGIDLGQGAFGAPS